MNSNIQTVLVTGSEGYIGAVLVPMLLEHGYTVHGVDCAYFGRVNLPHPRFYFHGSDVRDTASIPLDGIDAVIHLAALSNDPMGALNPKLTEEINQKATIRLARRAKKKGVQRFLFSSSCSIYGIADETVNEQSVVHPLTVYAKSKIACEKQLQRLADPTFCVGLLRNSTVFGYSPSFRNDLVVNNLTTSAYALGSIQIQSDGSPWRPLIDVRDLADIFMDFLQIESRRINGEIFNIGFDQNNFRVRDVVDVVHQVLPKSTIQYVGEQKQDSRSYRVSFAKFHSLFPKKKPHWSIQESVEDLVQHLKEEQYSEKEFEKNTYARLTRLQKLVTAHHIDSNLRQVLPIGNGTRVLVTGASGLVGSHLTEELVSKGVMVMGVFIAPDKRSYLYQQKLHKHIDVRQLDVRDRVAIGQLVREFHPEYIIHLAAQPIVDIARENPLATLDTNIMGTVNILEAARLERGIKGIIIASSDKAYGALHKTKYTEKDALHGTHPYDVSKSCTDLIAQTYVETYHLPIVITRFSNIYGEGDLNFSRIVPSCLSALIEQRILMLRSNGTHTRDYLYVKDAVSGYMAILEHLDEVVGEAFNFGSKDTYTVTQLIRRVEKILQKPMQVVIQDTSLNEITYQSLSCTKAERLLGWKQAWRFDKAIPRVYSYYREIL